MIEPKPRRTKARKSRSGPAANAERGEHSLPLGSKAYRLRPAFQASVAIEDETGLSLIELFRKANHCSLSYAEMGIIVAEYARAGAAEDDKMTRAVSAERMAELIYEEGTARVIATIVLLLGDAISGGRTSSGEAKAVTAPETETGTAT